MEIILASLVAGACTVFPTTPPCTCTPGAPRATVAAVREFVDRVDGAFAGRIIRLETVRDTAGIGAGRVVVYPRWVVATVALSERWKGPARDTLQLWTPAQTTMCGADLKVDEAYLFFPNLAADGRLMVDKCRAPRALAEASHDVGLLRQLRESSGRE